MLGFMVPSLRGLIYRNDKKEERPSFPILLYIFS